MQAPTGGAGAELNETCISYGWRTRWPTLMNGCSIRGHLDTSHCHVHARFNFLIAWTCPLPSIAGVQWHVCSSLHQREESTEKFSFCQCILSRIFFMPTHEMVGKSILLSMMKGLFIAIAVSRHTWCSKEQQILTKVISVLMFLCHCWNNKKAISHITWHNREKNQTSLIVIRLFFLKRKSSNRAWGKLQWKNLKKDNSYLTFQLNSHINVSTVLNSNMLGVFFCLVDLKTKTLICISSSDPTLAPRLLKFRFICVFYVAHVVNVNTCSTFPKTQFPRERSQIFHLVPAWGYAGKTRLQQTQSQELRTVPVKQKHFKSSVSTNLQLDSGFWNIEYIK